MFHDADEMMLQPSESRKCGKRVWIRAHAAVHANHRHLLSGVYGGGSWRVGLKEDNPIGMSLNSSRGARVGMVRPFHA